MRVRVALSSFLLSPTVSGMVRLLRFSDLIDVRTGNTRQAVRVDTPSLRNASEVSAVLLKLPGWWNWFSPTLDYEHVDLGSLSGRASGVVEQVARHVPLAIVETPDDRPWTQCVARDIPADDVQLQMTAIITQLQSQSLVLCCGSRDCFKVSVTSGLPLAADFTRAIDVRRLCKLDDERARQHLLSIWGEGPEVPYLWMFDMHILLEMAKHPHAPLSEEKLEGMRVGYLTDHPLIESGERDGLRGLKSGWCQTCDKYEGKCWEDGWRELVAGWKGWDEFAVGVSFPIRRPTYVNAS